VEKSGWDSIGGAMSTAQLRWTSEAASVSLHSATEDSLWYAVQTRIRFEKKVFAQLEGKGIKTFLPLIKQVHRWSDRRQVIEVALFPGYGFVRIPAAPDHRLRVLQTVGLTGLVTMNGTPIPVPEKQIEDVQLLLSGRLACRAYPFIKVGQGVRVRGGCLDGVEGILVSENKDHSLVIAIECIQRSLAIRIEGCEVEALNFFPAQIRKQEKQLA
jgi:transcription termination/antitermination protein NusG